MKIFLQELIVGCKRAQEVIEFSEVNFIYGQMGAGKSTIARLIDFCLGGDIELTPALQSEFVFATLTLSVDGRSLTIRRDAGAVNATVSYSHGGHDQILSIPVRKPDGVVIPETRVEVLSDLIFWLSGSDPIKVRRSKIDEDSELSRLSFRDLFWYCYLDQETIDSEFFHLDADAHPFKRLKSRDVLRMIVGFHQEKVGELENQLEEVRLRRMSLENAAKSMEAAMKAADIATSLELESIRMTLVREADGLEREIAEIRKAASAERPHGIEILQSEGRKLSDEIAETNNALIGLGQQRDRHLAHKNELISLSSRWLRSKSARAVIEGVAFAKCPRCTQALPARELCSCPVCGQDESNVTTEAVDALAANDLKSRINELEGIIQQHDEQIGLTKRALKELQQRKALVDGSIATASATYDSSYLSASLALERKLSATRQQLVDLEKLEKIATKSVEFQTQAELLLEKEKKLRVLLKAARTAAEKDTGNLNRLKELFLDCLVRSKISGFLPTDSVHIPSPHFLPEVMPHESGELAYSSFANIGSGGKKTLFKCCFAIALHRLVAEIGGVLPQLIIIDSAMKNISERENFEQFKGFHDLLYELAQSELKGSQFILIDKEIFNPPAEFSREFKQWHMMPDSDEFPPLIRYYRGQ